MEGNRLRCWCWRHPNSTYFAPANPGSRVTIQTVNGQPFDEGKTYTITSSDFVCAGGDTYYVMAKAADKTMKGTDCIISDSVQSYLQETCAGEVPATYEQIQGRITIL